MFHCFNFIILFSLSLPPTVTSVLSLPHPSSFNCLCPFPPSVFCNLSLFLSCFTLIAFHFLPLCLISCCWPFHLFLIKPPSLSHSLSLCCSSPLCPIPLFPLESILYYLWSTEHAFVCQRRNLHRHTLQHKMHTPVHLQTLFTH